MSFYGWSFADLAQTLVSFLSALTLGLQARNLVLALRLAPSDRHLEWSRVTRGAHV
jgi:hypothetical protein